MVLILEDSSSGPVPGDRTPRSWILGKRAARARSIKFQIKISSYDAAIGLRKYCPPFCR